MIDVVVVDVDDEYALLLLVLGSLYSHIESKIILDLY